MSGNLRPRVGQTSARTTMAIITAVIVAWVLAGLWLTAHKPDLVALAQEVPTDAAIGSCWEEVDDSVAEIGCNDEHLFEIVNEGIVTIYESD